MVTEDDGGGELVDLAEALGGVTGGVGALVGRGEWLWWWWALGLADGVGWAAPPDGLRVGVGEGRLGVAVAVLLGVAEWLGRWLAGCVGATDGVTLGPLVAGGSLVGAGSLVGVGVGVGRTVHQPGGHSGRAAAAASGAAPGQQVGGPVGVVVTLGVGVGVTVGWPVGVGHGGVTVGVPVGVGVNVGVGV